jgi:hypothetical protein
MRVNDPPGDEHPDVRELTRSRHGRRYVGPFVNDTLDGFGDHLIGEAPVDAQAVIGMRPVVRQCSSMRSFDLGWSRVSGLLRSAFPQRGRVWPRVARASSVPRYDSNDVGRGVA